MVQNNSVSLPPFTECRPSEECPRSAIEVWYEYMTFRQAVVDFFVDGHYEKSPCPGEAREKIDKIFYVLLQKQMAYSNQSNMPSID
jgi:hypothetical protein